MSVIRQILEYSRAPVVNGVIKGVKIVGNHSKHGRRYPQEVLARAIPLYENAPVYILHGDSREQRLRQRKHDQHFGHLANVREGAAGLFADLHIKQSHRLAGLIIESDGTDFGLSHTARCKMNDEESEVIEILGVDSVDLVDNPATTTNLFEGVDEMDLKELAEAQDANAKAIAQLVEGQDKVIAALESIQEASKAATEPPEKKPRPTALEPITVAEGGDEPEPIGNSHGDFLDCLRGFSITGGSKA
jgi:hypothetical protein